MEIIVALLIVLFVIFFIIAVLAVIGLIGVRASLSHLYEWDGDERWHL